MEIFEYSISSVLNPIAEIYIIRLIPKGAHKITIFKPGQFVGLANPLYVRPKEAHCFSIASPPQTQDYIEIGYRVYGNWTQAFSKLKVGDSVNVTGPFGGFFWEDGISDAVFLAGGIGITPFLSMLGTIDQLSQKPQITLLYGSRSEDTIIYRKEIEEVTAKIETVKLVHILSDLKPEDKWSGERGFMTEEFIKKYTDAHKNPKFFICGPPIFVTKILEILNKWSIPPTQIKRELFQ